MAAPMGKTSWQACVGLPFLRTKWLPAARQADLRTQARIAPFFLLSAYLSRLQYVNQKEGAEKLKRNKKRFLAGALAFLLTCSTLLELGTAARAADTETRTENLPELAEIQGQLQEDEVVVAEDFTLMAGDIFDGENKDPGLKYDATKVKVTYEKIIESDSRELASNIPGTYHALYRAEPLGGNPPYRVIRKVNVREKEQGSPSQQDSEGSGNQGEDSGADDGQDPQSPAEILDEIPDMPEDAEGMTNIYEDGEGVFLSVVPDMGAARQKARAAINANLEVGAAIPYPANLGNYSTNYFTVDGRVAYCLESTKATPPASDYVANEFEGNELLQKVLYYGYGGPGDVTDIYMPAFDTQLKYLFTHLAAAYAYCGIDGFAGCTMEDIEECGVWGFVTYLQGQETPPSSRITVSDGNPAVSLEGDVQKTAEQWLQGDPRSSIVIDLPENITCHYNGAEVTDAVEIFGGTSFYFTAPWNQKGTWDTGELQNQLGSQWKTMVLSTGNGNQDVGYGAFSAEEDHKVFFSVQWQNLARVVILKCHKEFGGTPLSGAVFEIYSDEECTNLIQQMPPTDENGKTEVIYPNDWNFVYVKESLAPAGYRRKQDALLLHMKTGDRVATVCNEEQTGKITVQKQGDILTGVKEENGTLRFQYGLIPYSGAKYTIYAAEDIYSQDQVTKYFDAGEAVARLQTGEDGSAVSPELFLGKYRVVERAAPEGLVLGETEEEWTKEIDLAYGDQDDEFAEKTVVFTNHHPEIAVKAIKKSKTSGTTLEGAVFGLYADSDITDRDGNILVASGTLIEQVTSDTDGNACFQSDIPIGFQYSVKEIQAPENYCRSDEVFTFTYEYKDDETYRYTFEQEFWNEEVRGEIHVKKTDKDTRSFVPQGDAQLVGAEYGLYAAEDIESPDKKGGALYKQGELVNKGRISDEGSLDFIDLNLGKYIIKEIEPPEGYLLDETEYPVNLSYEGQEARSIRRNVDVKENVKKQAFQILKISEDGVQTETTLVEGAGFKIFLISSLAGVKDGSLKPGHGSHFSAEDFTDYDFSGDETASYYEDGEKVTVPELFTDRNGYLKSPELPYGDYVVMESTVPENLHQIDPFIVHISEDSREPQAWRVLDDRPFQFLLKIKKKDAQTKKEVVDNSAAYKIYNVDKKEYVEMQVRYPNKEKVSVFYTSEDGSLVTPELLKSGTYRIEEVEAPKDYVQQGFEDALLADGRDVPLNEVTEGGEYQKAEAAPVLVTVDADTAHQMEVEAGTYTVLVEQSNNEAVGSLRLHKKGEKLKEAVNVETQFLNKVRNGAVSVVNLITGEEAIGETSGYAFRYEETDLEGVKFSVYAGNTIYTPDGQTDENGNRIVKYRKDALVASIVTGEDGTAVLNNLPVGSYYVVEEKTGENHVLDREKQEFEITYNGQKQAVDYVDLELTNERQCISIEISKKDSATGEPIAGVGFGLYAGEAIFDADGQTVVEKDALIETARTDETGKLVFQSDLPHGKYYAKETEKKPGYLDSGETYSFEADYQEPEENIIWLSCEAVNDPTVTEFSKTDLTDGQEIEGAKLQIMKDGNVVEEWISGKVPHTVYALEPGDYLLHEEAAAKGYLLAEDIKFTVQETEEIQKVEMQDERAMGQLKIRKTDSENGESLEGVEFTLYEKESGEEAAVLVTDKEGNAESGLLPIGIYEDGAFQNGAVYVLKETKAKEGYQKPDEEWEVIFDYQDGRTPVIEVLKEIQNTKEDAGTPDHAPKTGDRTRWLLPLMGIFAGGGCLSWMAMRARRTGKRRHARRKPRGKRR